MLRSLLITAAITTIAVTSGACTWVKMEPGGYVIRVARGEEDLSFCEPRGELTVAVRDRVAFYERSEVKVIDELEVLARNEAPRLQADTLQPRTQPVDGEQRFAAFRCRNASPTQAQQQTQPAEPERSRDAAVETFPLRGN